MRRRTSGKTAMWLAGVFLVCTAMSACDDDAHGLLVPADVGGGAQVARLDVSPDTVRIQRLGESVQLQVVAMDAGGATVQNPGIRWSTSDLTVVTVSAAGILTGQGQGRAVVTADAAGVQDQVIVSVALDATGTGTP